MKDRFNLIDGGKSDNEEYEKVQVESPLLDWMEENLPPDANFIRVPRGEMEALAKKAELKNMDGKAVRQEFTRLFFKYGKGIPKK